MGSERSTVDWSIPLAVVSFYKKITNQSISVVKHFRTKHVLLKVIGLVRQLIAHPCPSFVLFRLFKQMTMTPLKTPKIPTKKSVNTCIHLKSPSHYSRTNDICTVLPLRWHLRETGFVTI